MDYVLKILVVSGILAMLGSFLNINLMQDKTTIQELGMLIMIVGLLGMGVAFGIAKKTKEAS